MTDKNLNTTRLESKSNLSMLALPANNQVLDFWELVFFNNDGIEGKA